MRTRWIPAVIGAIAAVLAARLAAGCLLAGGLIGWRHPVPAAFLRFLFAAAAGLAAISILLGWNRPELPAWAALCGLTLGLWFVLRRTGAASRFLAAAMAGLGLAGAIAPALFGSFSGAAALAAGPLPAAAAGFSAAGLLGATAATMVLGHWYLVDTALPIRPLAFGASLFLGGAALRVLVAGLALAFGGTAALRLTAPSDLIYSTTALFFSFRAITGLAAPLVLAWLVRSTVRIRSTQSATGLLYVALILVLFGELTAVFLEGITNGALA